MFLRPTDYRLTPLPPIAEGFHSLITSQWDPSISRDVVSSWFDTMDSTGWIAREQMLGEEARSRVPPDFWVQRPDIANPPTLLFPVLALAVDGLCSGGGGAAVVGADGQTTTTMHPDDADGVAAFCSRRPPASAAAWSEAGDAHVCRFSCRQSGLAAELLGPDTPAQSLAFVRSLWPRLRSHLQWYHRTQAGPHPGSYRWRGATPMHNFASGLDDYPRGVVPSEMDESVDLLSWMAAAGSLLADLAPLVGEGGEEEEELRAGVEEHIANLHKHWDAGNGTFCDLGVARVEGVHRPGGPPPTLVHGYVCHVGYVSLMPLFLRLLRPDSPELAASLALLQDPALLWSPHGLRSLSTKDPLYRADENYWRSSIWPNMNFLAVGALSYYGGIAGPHAAQAGELAAALRANLVRTVVREHTRTGFMWEHYDDVSGRGWTSLLALMVGNRTVI